MPVRDNREYRSFDIPKVETREGEEPSFFVEGYASTWLPYAMFEQDGVTYYERIDPEAFEGTDFRDCTFLKDHCGTVFARTRNNTIQIDIDENGLHHRTDLSKTEAARVMFEEIKAGMYDQMSFAFTVEKEHYDKASHTRVIDRIKKVYDISPVAQPANPTTSIGVATRSIFDGYIEDEKADMLRAEKEIRERNKKALELKLKLAGF